MYCSRSPRYVDGSITSPQIALYYVNYRPSAFYISVLTPPILKAVRRINSSNRLATRKHHPALAESNAQNNSKSSIKRNLISLWLNST
jgi:hypothetical protein